MFDSKSVIDQWNSLKVYKISQELHIVITDEQSYSTYGIILGENCLLLKGDINKILKRMNYEL